jgi:apolipoprotein N-acyltransferase
MLPIIAAALLAAPFLEPWFFPLAWVAFVPLFFVIKRADSLRRAVFYGWLMGLAAHLIGFHWLTYTISVFGGLPFAVSVVVFVVYAALQGIQMALFALLVRTIGFGPLMIFPAIFWVVCEFLFPLLFPWYIANSQVKFLWLIQTADLVGPYGTGFIVMWFNAALYYALFVDAEPRKKILPLAYACLAIVVTLVYGFQRLQSVGDEMAGASKLSVGAVQGNVDIDMKWNPVLARKNLAQHLELSDKLAAVPLVIWPESAIEALIPENLQALPRDFLPSFKAARASFIFGAKSFRGTPGQPNFKAFNTAFFTDTKGQILARYHKQVLLAFGEYLPFAKLLSWIPAMPFADGFTPGPGPGVFHLPRSVRIAPLICYEDLMPELGRKFVSETRANVLVNLTNDAWYGKSVGPWQHLHLAQSRAIETRRSLLRVTNTGVTSLVNAKGELVKLLPMFTAAVMQTDVDVLNEMTYYVQFGDWFAWLMTIVTFALVLFEVKRSWLRK